MIKIEFCYEVDFVVRQDPFDYTDSVGSAVISTFTLFCGLGISWEEEQVTVGVRI